MWLLFGTGKPKQWNNLLFTLSWVHSRVHHQSMIVEGSLVCQTYSRHACKSSCFLFTWRCSLIQMDFEAISFASKIQLILKMLALSRLKTKKSQINGKIIGLLVRRVNIVLEQNHRKYMIQRQMQPRLISISKCLTLHTTPSNTWALRCD
jgi:hypothetical protein